MNNWSHSNDDRYRSSRMAQKTAQYNTVKQYTSKSETIKHKLNAMKKTKQRRILMGLCKCLWNPHGHVTVVVACFAFYFGINTCHTLVCKICKENIYEVGSLHTP